MMAKTLLLVSVMLLAHAPHTQLFCVGSSQKDMVSFVPESHSRSQTGAHNFLSRTDAVLTEGSPTALDNAKVREFVIDWFAKEWLAFMNKLEMNPVPDLSDGAVWARGEAYSTRRDLEEKIMKWIGSWRAEWWKKESGKDIIPVHASFLRHRDDYGGEYSKIRNDNMQKTVIDILDVLGDDQRAWNDWRREFLSCDHNFLSRTDTVLLTEGSPTALDDAKVRKFVIEWFAKEWLAFMNKLEMNPVPDLSDSAVRGRMEAYSTRRDLEKKIMKWIESWIAEWWKAQSGKDSIPFPSSFLCHMDYYGGEYSQIRNDNMKEIVIDILDVFGNDLSAWNDWRREFSIGE